MKLLIINYEYKNMKFISKSTNLLIVLRPGLSAQPITGTPAKPTISVRFKDGIAEVNNQELIDLMLAHPGFNGDFISAESVGGNDPYADTRVPSEPAHTMTEMQFGTPVKTTTVGGKKQLPPELKKIVEEMAAKLAEKQLPGMVESVLRTIVKNNEGEKADNATSQVGEKAVDGVKVIKKPGRPGRPKATTAKKTLKVTPKPIEVPQDQEVASEQVVGNPASQESVS